MQFEEHQAQLNQYKNYEIMQKLPPTESAIKAFKHKPYPHIRGLVNGNKKENTNK